MCCFPVIARQECLCRLRSPVPATGGSKQAAKAPSTPTACVWSGRENIAGSERPHVVVTRVGWDSGRFVTMVVMGVRGRRQLCRRSCGGPVYQR
jgi:hypothetical protein